MKELGETAMRSDTAAEVAISLPARAPIPYPAPFASKLEGRVRRPLGDVFGIRKFGVNLTTLEPGAQSSLHHRHSKQDELVFILKGQPTLVTDSGDQELRPGMCAGFAANGTAHHIENRSQECALILEIGDRSEGDDVDYPRDDLRISVGSDGRYCFTKKDGTPY